MPEEIRGEMVYVGIKGSVVALSRATGDILWTAPLTGADFVSLMKDDDIVLAATRGEIFCLDAETGALRWRNKLPGMGFGIITMATSAGNTALTPQAKRRHDEEAAAAAS